MRLRLENATRGTVVASSVESGDSFWARFRGLMGRPALAPGEGLWLPGTSSIHMLFMRFPIDCAFLSRPDANGERRIVAARRALPPWRGIVWWARGADGVVELASGALDASQTASGDAVRFVPA